jgi:hypothetical protein
MERQFLEDVGVDMRIIVNRILEIGGCVDWVDLLQKRDNLRAFVNVVMNLRFP